MSHFIPDEYDLRANSKTEEVVINPGINFNSFIKKESSVLINPIKDPEQPTAPDRKLIHPIEDLEHPTEPDRKLINPIEDLDQPTAPDRPLIDPIEYLDQPTTPDHPLIDPIPVPKKPPHSDSTGQKPMFVAHPSTPQGPPHQEITCEKPMFSEPPKHVPVPRRSAERNPEERPMFSSVPPKPTRTPQTPAAPAAPQVPHPGASSAGTVDPTAVPSIPVKVAAQNCAAAPMGLASRFKRATAPKKTGAFAMMKKLEKTHIIRVDNSDVYIYTGNYYRKVTRQEIERTVMAVCQEEVAENGNFTALKQVYDGLLADPTIAVSDTDCNDQLVPFQDGILCLNDGSFMAHSSKIFNTYCLNACYQGFFGGCPTMDAFLNNAMRGNPGLIDRAWEILGYILTPDVQGKCVFCFQGVPSSGKSILTDFFSSYFDPELVSRLDVHDLHRNFASSELRDRMLWISPDMTAKPLDPISVAQIKKLSGRDRISADVKYSPRVQFSSHAKLVMVTNYKLQTQTPDEAFMQRVVALPFDWAPSPEHQDRGLLQKLISERNAIAQKAIRSYFVLKQKNYRFSGQYVLNTSEGLLQYEPDISDPAFSVYSFAKECLVPSPGGFLFLEDIYPEYLAYAEELRISKNKFASLFYKITEEMYGSEHKRSRKTPGSNPQYGVEGLAFRR